MSRVPLGSVRRTATGWQFRIQIQRVEYKETLPTEELANQALAALRERAMSEAPDEPTLASFGKEWLNRRETGGVFKHVDKERSAWNAHVLTSRIADIPLAALQRRHVAEYVEKLTEKIGAHGKRLERQTVKHALRLVKKCLDAAADRGLVKANPAKDVRVERRAGGPQRWTFLTSEEIDAVLVCDQPAGLELERRALYAVAIFGGLRKSELWRLRWEHVHLDVKAPHLRVVEGKSADAVRLVPLLPHAVPHVRAWRDTRGGDDAKGLVWPSSKRSAKSKRGTRGDDADAGWRDHPYYYVDAEGRRVRRVRLGTRSRAGITRPVRFHDLRHTCGSHLAQGTWTPEPLDLYEIKKWLGHSSITVTQRYAHLSPEGILRFARPPRKPPDDGD